MFKALATGVFFLLLIWVRWQRYRRNAVEQRLTEELSKTQHDLKQAQQQVQQVVGLLNALHDHKVSPTGLVAWQELFDFTVKTASALVGAETVVLLHWDTSTSVYRGISAHGLSPQSLSQLRIRAGEGVLGRAAQGGKVVVSPEAATGALLSYESFLTQPYIVLPLWVHAEVRGVLVFSRFNEASSGAEPKRLAVLMAKHLEVIMENLDLSEDRNRTYSVLVSTLVLALEARGSGGRAHADHSAELIRSMAKEMHLPRMLAEQIEYGAVLHDIGKLALPDAILNKAGELSAEEYAAVKTHPEVGYHILQGVDFLKGIAPIVLYHHEWVNGQGYPEGLAGEEIPLGARMVAIVDAWDAMTTDQPYRSAMSKSSAVAELRQQAGTQFDPKLVDVFVHVMDRMERAVPQPNG